MRRNVLFRGCTRPAMFLGVPYLPFFMAAGGCLLLAMYFNLLFLLLMPIVIMVMRQMARQDEMIFRLLGLRLQFRTRARNLPLHRGLWAFPPTGYWLRVRMSRIDR
jgi:type IV secretion system protein VirB3